MAADVIFISSKPCLCHLKGKDFYSQATVTLFIVEDQSDRGSSWPLYLVGALFAVVVATIGAWNVELPYLAFSTGPVSDAADSIVVEEVEVYPPEGELLMLTVVSQDVNPFEALIAGIDPTIDLVPKEAYRPPDESDEDYRKRVLQQMDDSQTRAITVALEHLGYEMVPTDVLITDLVPDLPAAEVLQIGDSVDRFNDTVIGRSTDLTDALEGLEPGDLADIEVTREGTTQTLEVELGARDDEEGGAMIGIIVGELTEPPFPVSIRAGNVGGPSAGMMHALAIIDSLTPGEMTKGHIVAGTGTIAYDATVGAIGGVRQKVVAAEAAGAGFILVPESNYEAALTAPRETIEIVSVATLQDAVDFLESLPEA
jgi:PDZ domain-containing protein